MRRRAIKAKTLPPTATAPRGAINPQPSTLNYRVWLPAVLLGLATIAVYWPATHCDFVSLDDQLYVTANVHVQQGLTLADMNWAFFQPDAVYGYWHPLTLLSHMLDCQLYDLNPWGHHLSSVLLHALNAALVYLLLRILTGGLWRSLTVAALFAFHPLHVESVAWIAERKDVLSTFFGLLTLVAYGRYAAGRNIEHRTSNTEHRTKDGKLYYGLALVFFALGLMSKPMLVTIPFVMLLLDWWPLCRSAKLEVRNEKADWLSTINYQLSTLWPLVLEKIPFFVLAAAASGMTFVLSKEGGVLISGQAMSLDARAENAVISYCRYLGKLFWPSNLAVFYPHPIHWPMWQVLLAGGLLTGITALCFASRQRHPFLLMGWLWFIGTLAPVIGLVQVGEHAMADRYAYIPCLGVFIATIWWLCEQTRHWRFRLPALSAVGAAAIAICITLTYRQLGYWQDSETLFRHALEVTKDNYLAHKGLGDALDQKGDYAGAMSEFQAALRLRPGYADAHGSLGNVLLESARADEAIDQYREAIRLKPDDYEFHCNLGNALLNKGQVDGAIGEFQQAVQLKPDLADAHYDLGVAFYAHGDLDVATGQFQQTIELNPHHAPAYNNLGYVLYQEGRLDEAVEDYREAIRLKPDYEAARANLARALATTNAPAGP